MTAGLAVATTCLHCGAGLRLVNQGRPAQTEAVGVVECDECGRGYTVLVRLVAESKPDSRRRAKYRVAA